MSLKIFSPSQFGFHRAQSTADTLTNSETFITFALARHDSILAKFFELEKAYDTTWWYHNLQQLSSLGIYRNVYMLKKSFLSKHTFQVKIASTSSFLQVEGVPQDSVLSTSFLIVVIINSKRRDYIFSIKEKARRPLNLSPYPGASSSYYFNPLPYLD